MLCGVLDQGPAAPAAMLGSLASVVLPASDEPLSDLGIDPLQERLFDEHHIEVPVMRWPHALESGAARALAKPVKRAELVRAVSELLGPPTR
jgi:isopenicillin-N epimerase